MIEVGDLVAFDDPNTLTTRYGVVTWTADFGSLVVKVNFGDSEDTIFDAIKLWRIA